MAKYVCSICGYIYDDAENPVPFSELADDWKCPLCGAPKELFNPVEEEPAPEPVKEEAKAPAKKGSALHKFSYGLFVVTAKREDGFDNGCIINTAIQVADNPKQVSICVNKANYTCELIDKTGEFNLSFLSQDAKFEAFQRFGFQSGRDTDKFEGYSKTARSENGLIYVTEDTNAFVSVKVTKTVDLGSHLMFIGEVTEEDVLSDVPSVTYQYYFDHIKPAPQKTKVQKGWVCKICGYVYEGEVLPPDYICPICKHGAEDFEPLF